MRLKYIYIFKRESWPRKQRTKFNIKEQTSNVNTQQEKHLMETNNRFKTPSKINQDNLFTGLFLLSSLRDCSLEGRGLKRYLYLHVRR